MIFNIRRILFLYYTAMPLAFLTKIIGQIFRRNFILTITVGCSTIIIDFVNVVLRHLNKGIIIITSILIKTNPIRTYIDGITIRNHSNFYVLRIIYSLKKYLHKVF